MHSRPSWQSLAHLSLAVLLGCGGAQEVAGPGEQGLASAKSPLASGWERTLVQPGLADPDIYKETDDLFFLTGTGDAQSVPIYQTTDLTTYQLKRSYNPSAVDPTYDYCMVWAPDLNKANGVYTLTFSAQRVPNGAACPASGQDVTTFTATAPDLNLNFGVPQPINPNTTYPRSNISAGCVKEGCNHTVRIDSATYNDASGRWFF